MFHTALDTPSITRVLDELLATKSCPTLLALLPEAEKSQLPLLQAACRERRISLVGAIFPALVVAQKFITHGAWLLCFTQRVPAFLIPSVNAGEVSAIQRIVADVNTGLGELASDAPKPTLFLMFDSMVPNIGSILDGIYLELANRVEYAGTNAGSETFQAMPCLFDESQLLGDGVLGLLLPGTQSTVLEHGFTKPERAMTATSTEHNRITMIDWRPAFDVYREMMQADYGINLTAENFYQHAVHFPFGILRANGDVVVRIPVGLADDGSLFCVGEVPENSILLLLKAPAADANQCIDQLAGRLVAENGALNESGLLLFYCAGRRMHLGADATDEVARLHAATGVRRVAGALSLGEIGSTSRWGYPVFHNATLICRPWLGQ